MTFIQLVLSGLALGAAYALVALGFVFIVNATGAVNFAQGDFVMAGGYAAIFLTSTFSIPMVLLLPLVAVITFVMGVFLQANFGRRSQLVIAGVPIGKKIPGEVYKEESGSCIAVVATDAPLLPNQLRRLARRVSLGLARTGTISGNGSGDLFIAFSTANPNVASPNQVTHSVQTIPNDLMDPLFTGVVQATEEAVVNALVDNHSMTGRDNHHVEALPHDRLRELLKRFR